MKKTPRKKTCPKGHIFYKSSDCLTCPACEKEKTKESIWAELGSPVRRALEHAEIKTIKHLSNYTEKEILDMHGIGPSSMPIFKKKLQEAHLDFQKNTKKG